MDDRKFLLSCILSHGIKTGKFRLTSGNISNTYIDCKTVCMMPAAMDTIGRLFLDEIKDENVLAVGGMEFGAIPISLYTCMKSLTFGDRVLDPFVIRKNPRGHGTEKRIEGLMLPTRVALVDDVVTTGSSIVDSIGILYGMGTEVSKVVVMVDREEGAKERIEKMGIKFSSIFKLSEILKEYKEEE